HGHNQDSVARGRWRRDACINWAAPFQAGTGLRLSSRRVHHVSHRCRYCPLSLDAIGAGRVVLETKIRDFTNDEEVRELVRAFEEATVLPSQFHHCAHIAVALSYLAEAPLDDETVRMRERLRNVT